MHLGRRSRLRLDQQHQLLDHIFTMTRIRSFRPRMENRTLVGHERVDSQFLVLAGMIVKLSLLRLGFLILTQGARRKNLPDHFWKKSSLGDRTKVQSTTSAAARGGEAWRQNVWSPVYTRESFGQRLQVRVRLSCSDSLLILFVCLFVCFLGFQDPT